jgi:hypothetical protein
VSALKGFRKTDLALVAVSLLLAGALILVLLEPQSVVKPVTVTSTVALQPPVEPWVYQWAYGIQSRDVNLLASMYAPGANITWKGNIPGQIAGTYEGRSNIGILYGSTLGKFMALAASISNYNEETASSSVENVTFFLAITANSSVVGTVKMAATVTQSWNYTGGQWQVLQESWNYVTYDVQFPVMTG